ncbi:antibiotic biosynthesis monooxygenase [Hyunsoonleella sp. SJ7]|uniref:Antibiotic biosynthesis monooxygenase n=1 Tax=Hyunsoonleella aquatilis TaxID=2762758 RepID=A0A923KGJ0_9FLAO|nr:antibiotic biosynthesis monooxygenase [Hyunsoonleella aquatilis]MBC3758451.1 antibiotic biosynthesis monooxygenase [Hyunsoonleella aquatilis]
MYIVLYSFKVKPGQEHVFIEGWKGLTQLIYQYEGSLGSRLHKKADEEYVAYAQWPSKEKFESSGSNLPEEANRFRSLMKTSCEAIKIADKFEVIEDLLSTKPYD